MLSFLLLLPAALLFLTALGIVLLQQYRPSIGYAWLIGTLGALLSVGAALFLRWRIPLEIVFEPWRIFGDLSTPPSLRLDTFDWPYVMALSVLALAFLLSDAARLETEAIPLNWAEGLAIAGLGMLAVMANNPVTLIVAWTAVDIVEFLMIIVTPAGQRMGAQLVLSFSVRVSGTLLVILTVLLAYSRGMEFDLSPIPSELAIFMLLSAGLRLGVLPLNIPYVREVYAFRGLGNVMRMIGPASSLMVLGRMPEQVVPVEWRGLLLVLSALAALYGAAMWMTADNELNGRPYWSISLAALAVASVIGGVPRGSIAWGAALILAGSVLFFYSARRKQILFIPALTVLSFLGLPFTPTAAGWTGLVGTSFTVLYFFAMLFLGWGFVRHTLRPRDELYRLERWVHAVYPFGLFSLLVGLWAIGLAGWPGSLTVGVWWISAAVLMAFSLGLVLFLTFRQRLSDDAMQVRWLIVFGQRAGSVLGAIFRLNWLYHFLEWVYRISQNVIGLLTAMLEGDGGVLWSLVMLALIISLITASNAASGGSTPLPQLPGGLAP